MAINYGGFRGLDDYLTQRCNAMGMSYAALSKAIGKTHSYIHGIAAGNFAPSRKVAQDIALFFGDHQRTVLILSDLESIPPN